MARFLIILILIGVLGWMLSTSYVFRIVFRNGRIHEVKGRAPGPLAAAFEEVASHSNLTGTVSLYPGRILKFSGPIPGPDRQRFRNVLASML